MARRMRALRMAACLLVIGASCGWSQAAEEPKVNSLVDVDCVGEVVDFVRMGSNHWSQASGDPNPDVVEGIRDIDDSFGEHQGKLVGTKTFKLFPGNEVRMVLKAPEPGRYVICFRGMTGKENRYVLEYRKGDRWVKLPEVSGDPDWAQGWQEKVFCMVVETAAGQKDIPIKIYSTKARLALSGVALARLRVDPFDGKPAEGARHPIILFSQEEIPGLRAKIMGHPYLSAQFERLKEVGWGKSMLEKGEYDTPGRVQYFRHFLLRAAVTSAINDDPETRQFAIQMVEKALTWKNWMSRLGQADIIRTMSAARSASPPAFESPWQWMPTAVVRPTDQGRASR